jgi:hypothetical protein
MKRLLLISFTVALLAGAAVDTAGSDKYNNRLDGYKNTLEIVEEGNFLFRAQRAFPVGGSPVYLTSNYGYIEISGSTSEAGLPFFGRIYNIRDGRAGNIEFTGVMENLNVAENPDKLRIRYSFEVRDDDNYKVIMDIGYNGDAMVSILTNNRSHISYQGDISRTEK